MKTTLVILMLILIAAGVSAQDGSSYYYRPTATQPMPVMAGQIDYGTSARIDPAAIPYQMPPQEHYDPYQRTSYQQELQGQSPPPMRASQFFYPGRSGLPYIAPGYQFAAPQQTPYGTRPNYRTPAMPEALTEHDQGYFAGYDEGYVAGAEGRYAGFEAYMAFKFYNDVRFDARPQVGYYVLNYQPKKITVRTVQTDYTDGYQTGLEAGFRDGFAQIPYQGIPPFARNQNWAEPSFGSSGRLSPASQPGYGGRYVQPPLR